MYSEIREEMARYPVFSSNEVLNIDQTDIFKDQKIINKNKNITNPNCLAQCQKKHQTIVSIYDRIARNNANDPLFPKKQRFKTKNNSAVNSARNSRQNIDKQLTHNNTIHKFVGQFAQNLSRQESRTRDVHRVQKLSLLRRIIQHYNIKSIQKKYYSNLVKTFGLRIQSFNSTQIAVKKDLHPRLANQKIKELPENIDKASFDEKPSNNKKPQLFRKFRHMHSSTIYKQEGGIQQQKSKESQIKSSHQKRLYKKRTSKQQSRYKGLRTSQKLVQKPIKIHNNTNSIEKKINKYREFLFAINFSNHFYRELDIEKYQTTFKYYVGKGNNRNLIKSLMKKRFWFQQVANPHDANFIWTQIKLQSVYENQLSGEQGEKIQSLLLGKNEQLDDQEELSSFQIFKSKQLGQCLNSKKGKQLKFIKNKSNAKHFQPTDPLLKILSIDDIKSYKQVINCLNKKMNYSFSDRLRYAKGHIKNSDDCEGALIHNHLPLNGLLGNKKAMFYNIREFCNVTNTQLSNYIPLTFHIKNGFLDKDYKQMSSVFNERKKKNLSNYWIIKPGQFSNRGQGITCTNKLEDIRKRIIQCRQLSKEKPVSKKTKFKPQKNATLIVQLYISDPLLYNSRKFDIRAFMMVTITNGKLKGYWYQEGYVRTSSFIWTLNEIEDQYIHLTNDAVQKNCQEYGLFEPGNKLTYQQLQRYLDTLPAYGRNLNFFAVVYPKMRSIAADLIKSTFLNLDRNRKRDNFQIFGLDFMIDNNFKPWLIQVNTNPCLQLSCPILQRIIPYMVENSFRVALDPLFPPPSSINQQYKYAIPENALHYNKYELIFDEDSQGELFTKLYKNSSIMKQLDDFQEDQQIFEEEGNILDLTEI